MTTRPISAAGGERHRSSKLKILDYYLTFIHYFGYSINPSDEPRRTRQLSMRVKLAAAASVANSLPRLRLLAVRRRHLNQRALNGSFAAVSGAPNAPNASKPKWPRGLNEAGRRGSGTVARLAALCRSIRWQPLKALLKFIAISLTTFLTMNHVIVLVHYLYDGQKVFTEMLLELRLVITKFSALIFVISWHRNQLKVRQLIKLVKSTSLYILNTTSEALGGESSFSAKDELELERRACELMGAGGFGAEEVSWRLKRLDWRVAKWWLMCTCITVMHFSLSEAEIRTAQHLWQWLEDYSLHQLNNQTTSISSLFIMASFDNYVYTVHVYGTRLIGASIICIVCTFQIENIRHLDEQALGALCSTLRLARRQRVNSSANWATAEGANSNGAANDNAGERRRCSRAVVLDRQLFFVLGESDWLQVERNRRHSPPIGWLSATVALHLNQLRAALRRLGELLARLAGACGRARATRAQRANLGARAAHSNRVTPTPGGNAPTLGGGGDVDDDDDIGRRRAPTLDFVSSSSLDGGRRVGAPPDGFEPTPIMRGRFNAPAPDCAAAKSSASAAAGLLLLVPPPPPPPQALSFDQATTTAAMLMLVASRRAALRAPSLGHKYEGPLARCQRHFGPAFSLLAPTATGLSSLGALGGLVQGGGAGGGAHCNHCNSALLGQQLELHLDNLARKYELIRTVNSRVENCFGHMLLSQYSFLFLMSCIDVVYFSLSFNPKTKTKYIIVSGMILLWWPYLLLYKFASDIGLASRKLLTSVRRLARLALVLQLAAGERGAAAAASGDHQRLRPPAFGLAGAPFGRQPRPAEPRAAKESEKQATRRARIFNKLDHVFKPCHLSIVGIMTMDKFFLLNFAKIVITASVMAIQFISKG